MKSIKKYWPALFLILVFVLLFIYLFTFKEITYEEDRSLLFVTLPSPPQAKIITDKEEIQSIIGILNDSSKFGHGLNGRAGWIGQIRYKGVTYIINNKTTIEVNRVMYKLAEEKGEKLFEIYRKSQAVEEDFGDQVLERFNEGKKGGSSNRNTEPNDKSDQLTLEIANPKDIRPSTKELLLVLENQSDHDIRAGEAYALKRNNQGEWTVVDNPISYEDLAYIIRPGERKNSNVC
ncbi:MAG: hypothetical protein PT957_05600 [Firmicutes bacterium]|nr:hypothetical protein [Bacillota bacterium]